MTMAQHVSFSEATIANHAVAAAVTGKRIRVLSYVLAAADTQTVQWKSATTAISGAMTMDADATAATSMAISSGYSPVGHMETAAGEALNLDLTTAKQVSGHVTYEVV